MLVSLIHFVGVNMSLCVEMNNIFFHLSFLHMFMRTNKLAATKLQSSEKTAQHRPQNLMIIECLTLYLECVYIFKKWYVMFLIFTIWQLIFL